MQKMLFTLAAMAVAGAVASLTSQNVEAATVNPAAISQAGANTSVIQADWRRYDRRSWNRRRYRGHGYGYRG